jgi:beta-glucosidase
MAFPKGFFWGAATASFQVEGGIENCDWAQGARDGKVPVCGMTCDHYNRFASDFDLAKELGHNAHRFSIEWARIEPREGEFDESELNHYVQVAQALRDRGVEPFVTLWHFTLPIWFVERGGWDAKDSHSIFARYCAKVVEKLSPLCVHFATMNEPLVYAGQGWSSGQWAPFKKDSRLATVRIARRLVRAHRAAYDACKIACPTCDISLVKHNIYFHAAADRAWPIRIVNTIRASVAGYVWNRWFLNKTADKLDTIGINYYKHHELGSTKHYETNDMGWQLYPDGLRGVLVEAARYGKPIFVAEAGIADKTDAKRAGYIEGLIVAVEQAIDQGARIRGFMYWSLLDNYEWAFGFSERFGLIEVNYETQERIIRPSALRYKEMIAEKQASEIDVVG